MMNNNEPILITYTILGDTDAVKLIIKTIKLIKKDKAQLNVVNNYGNTALILSAVHGHSDIAKLLIEAGANVDVVNNYGATALMRAALHGRTKIVKLLIEAGANMDVVDNYGYTALNHARFEKYADIVELLSQAKRSDLDIESMNNLG